MAKGIFTSDFIVSLAVFVVVLAMAAPLWDGIRSQAAFSSLQKQTQADALTAADALVRGAGSPREWDAGTVKSIGLADEEHVLNATKARQLANMLKAGYYSAKGIMGLAPYELNYSITSAGGSPVVLEGNETAAYSNASVSSAAYSIRRTALLQLNATHRQIVNLNLVVWR